MVKMLDKFVWKRLLTSDGTLDYGGDPFENRYLLGESEWAEFYLPPSRRELRRDPETQWKRRFNKFNPTHWPYFIGSLVRQRVVWLEQG